MRKDLVKKTRDLVKRVLGNSFSHGYPHIERVHRIAWDIARHEGLDIDPLVLDLSVYLHDIGRVLGEPHAYYSALFTKSYLLEQGLDNSIVEKIINAILYHSFSYARRHDIKPLCEEAKILSDADKLDALGIIGFLRVFHYSWENSRTMEEIINHFQEKILKLHTLMHYQYSREKSQVLLERTRKALNYFLEEIGYTL